MVEDLYGQTVVRVTLINMTVTQTEGIPRLNSDVSREAILGEWEPRGRL
jgi:hypothetical protein